MRLMQGKDRSVEIAIRRKKDVPWLRRRSGEAQRQSLQFQRERTYAACSPKASSVSTLDHPMKSEIGRLIIIKMKDIIHPRSQLFWPQDAIRRSDGQQRIEQQLLDEIADEQNDPLASSSAGASGSRPSKRRSLRVLRLREICLSVGEFRIRSFE